MPYKKTKPDRDKTFQPRIRGESFEGNVVFFDNIYDAIKSIGCTKKELVDAIQRNQNTPDDMEATISYYDPNDDPDDRWPSAYWWSYVDT